MCLRIGSGDDNAGLFVSWSTTVSRLKYLNNYCMNYFGDPLTFSLAQPGD